jgi:ornithine cyclodeaminase
VTRYIDIKDVQRLVRATGVETFITQLAGYIRADYLRWSQFAKCARVANHSAIGVIELMPASDDVQYAFKYVNGHPKNIQRNMLTVMAFGALADMRTGYPALLSELTITTALRTAATSALVAQSLARSDSRVMAIIGNGAQSEFQILAFKALLGIREIRAYDIDPAATQKLMRNLSGMTDLQIVAVNSVHEAVKGADIVTTVTADKTNATILTPDMIVPGMHINAVGGDCPGKTELHADILRDGRVIVEFEPQTRIEGDIQQMPDDFAVTEFWEVLSGRAAGRQNEQEVTVFDSVGFALEDFSALRYLNDVAKAQSVGSMIELVPVPENPKDLFQYVAAHVPATATWTQPEAVVV